MISLVLRRSHLFKNSFVNSLSTQTSSTSYLASRWPQLGTAFTAQQPVPVDVALTVIKESFHSLGKEPYFGEPVTHQEHALQCALLAEKAGHDEDVIVAALLHDIGHICTHEEAPHMNIGGPDVGVVDHETVGKDLLHVLGFSKYVTNLVESHVPSKRYLVSIDEEYRENLAEDSLRSLTFQGGGMTTEEIQSFDTQDPILRGVQLEFRAWDEQGKCPGVVTPSMDYYYPMVERHLAREQKKKIKTDQKIKITKVKTDRNKEDRIKREKKKKIKRDHLRLSRASRRKGYPRRGFTY